MSKELCLLIAEDLSIPDLCNFLRTCRGLLHLLAPRLLELGLQGRGELTVLQWAAKRSHESLVVQEILNGAQVNETTKCGHNYTALHLAAMSMKPNPNIIETLVKHGARIDARDSELHTALHLAPKSVKPSPDIIEILVKYGAQIDAQDSEHSTALHLAARSVKSSPDIIETLVKHGAKINAKDSSFRSPLYVATVFGRETVVEVLLRLGAGMKEDSQEGLNALVHLATSQGFGGCTRAFIAAGFDFQNRGRYGQTILHEAVSCGTSGTRFLTAHYILGNEGGRSIVNSKDLWGQMPMHYLVGDFKSLRGERLEMVKLLLLCGTDIQAGDDNGCTPAHIVAGSEDIEIMGELFRAGFDINTKTHAGVTVLHRAASCQAKMVKYLLELEGGRLSINAQNAHGNTPLHLAVEGDLDEVVKLLLENGLDTEITNREGRTPLQLAHRRGNTCVMKAFIDAGVKLNLNLGGIATPNTVMIDM